MPTDFLEKTLEDIVFENCRKIHKYGLSGIYGHLHRQVILPSGKRLDMIEFNFENGKLWIKIYELKRERVSMETFMQAFAYYEEIENCIFNHFPGYKIEIILIGNDFTNHRLFDFLKIPLSIFVYDYTIDGISFVRQRLKGINPAHANSLSNKIYPLVKDQITEWYGQPSTPKERQDVIHYQKIRYIENKPKEGIKTIVFPEQPDWSPEFLAGIDFGDISYDLEFDEDFDCEIEHDLNTGDFEASEIHELIGEYSSFGDYFIEGIVDRLHFDSTKLIFQQSSN